MPDKQRMIKLFILFIVIFTLLLNLLNLIYMESYNRSDTAAYNYEKMISSSEMSEKEFCLSLKQPFGGMTLYRQLFPFSFLMIIVSALIVSAAFVFTTPKRRIFSQQDRYIFIFFIFTIVLSYAMLLTAWTDVIPSFYNCTKFYGIF